VRKGEREREREEWDTGVKMFIEGQRAERERVQRQHTEREEHSKLKHGILLCIVCRAASRAERVKTATEKQHARRTGLCDVMLLKGMCSLIALGGCYFPDLDLDPRAGVT
jgi:2,3-bisphosphoglycerate-independent phosphoglycerate mutase